MGVPKSVRYKYKGQELDFYYIGSLAEAIGRTSATLRKWEIAGIIPPTPFKDGFGRRLYLQDHIKAVVECAERCGIGQGKNFRGTRFKEHLQKRFDEINKKYINGGENNEPENNKG